MLLHLRLLFVALLALCCTQRCLGEETTIVFSNFASEAEETLTIARNVTALIRTCVDAWNQRDTAALTAECFDEAVIIAGPRPTAPMDLPSYIHNLQASIAAMPDSHTEVRDSGILANTLLTNGSVCSKSFAVESTYTATFLDGAEWGEFVGKGQKIQYTSLAVGTISPVSGLIDSMSHYYSLADLLAQMMHPNESSPSGAAPARPRERGAEERREDWDQERVRQTCLSFIAGLGKPVEVISMLTSKVTLKRMPPWTSISGRNQVLEHLKEGMNHIVEHTLLPTSIVVSRNKCALEYHRKGNFVGPVWGIQLPVCDEEDDCRREFETAMVIALTKDMTGNYLVRRVVDYLDPFYFTLSLGL